MGKREGQRWRDGEGAERGKGEKEQETDGG